MQKSKKNSEKIGKAENLDIEQKYYTAIIGIVAIVAVFATTILIFDLQTPKTGLAYHAYNPPTTITTENSKVTVSQVYCQKNLGPGVADPEGWYIDCSDLDCNEVKDSYESLGYSCMLVENTNIA